MTDEHEEVWREALSAGLITAKQYHDVMTEGGYEVEGDTPGDECKHEWVQILLFTGTMTYCKKCDKEKK